MSEPVIAQLESDPEIAGEYTDVTGVTHWIACTEGGFWVLASEVSEESRVIRGNMAVTLARQNELATIERAEVPLFNNGFA